MVIFVIMTNILLLTSLIAILSQSLIKVSQSPLALSRAKEALHGSVRFVQNNMKYSARVYRILRVDRFLSMPEKSTYFSKFEL